MTTFRKTLLLSAAFLALPALAQDYPSKTITVVVPFTAGGGVDAIARLLADKLRVSLGQSVVIDNKPGASGMLGANAVAKAKGFAIEDHALSLYAHCVRDACPHRQNMG